MSSRFVRNPAFLGGGGSTGNISITFQAEGFEETSAALKKMADALLQGTYEAMTEVIYEGAAIARAEAPVDTGNLRSNVFAEQEGRDRVSMHSMAPYSGFVNYGHKTRGNTFVPPQPFFSEGAEHVKQNMQRRVNERIRRV